jgi:hypothetical protein
LYLRSREAARIFGRRPFSQHAGHPKVIDFNSQTKPNTMGCRLFLANASRKTPFIAAKYKYLRGLFIPAVSEGKKRTTKV